MRLSNPVSGSGVKARQGFTLVEMLVAVALVLLMMTMFGEIFSIASSSVSLQRGIANNDQRARAMDTMFRGDLSKRSFREVLSFLPGEDPNTTPHPYGGRRGYFYISTNDRFNGVDDVLQLTINTASIRTNGDETPIFGRGTALLSGPLTDLNGDGNTDSADLIASLVNNPNQPDADDGQVEPDRTSQSSAAEVSYFLRHGNLYRRVLLIREPLELAGEETEPQPELADGSDPFQLTATGEYWTSFGPRRPGEDPSFWNDFDFSAHRTFNSDTGVFERVQFHGLNSLENEPSGATFFSLGKPSFRFGHDVITGQPREFGVIDNGGDLQPAFFGRFLQEETSHPNFGYPQWDSGFDTDGDGTADGTGTNPFDPAVAHVLGETRVITSFQGGDRRSEDLLLTNVHEFRVEIWDERLQRFVAPGHEDFNLGGEMGDYHQDRCINTGYGSAGSDRAAFDTWHPGLGSLPPYRAMQFYPPDSVAFNTADNPGIPVDKRPEIWAPDRTFGNMNHYEVGDRVFPFTVDRNGNGSDEELGADSDGVLDFPAESHSPTRPMGYAFYYVCIRAGESGLTAPPWQAREGALVTDTGANPAIWRAVPNLRPLDAVRVTLRFIDPGTERVRQISITQSLTE